MRETIKLKANVKNLVGNLRYAFTDDTVFLVELMQNARRAGASVVSFDFDESERCLTVTDDGCGIENLQHILTIAESGWNEDIREEETPYGMGFLSALFIAERVSVESRGRAIHFNTRDVLEFGQVG